MKETVLENVLKTLEEARASKSNPIPFDNLDYWISHDDVESLEVTAAIVHYLDYDKVTNNVTPPIKIDWYARTFMHYTKQCIMEDRDGEWRDSRYQAGWNFASWFNAIWQDKEKYETQIKDSKLLLRNLYLEGDDDIRVCVVNAILEHMFSDKSIAKFFLDWRNDEILNKAYRDALLWDGENPW
jgi:hypothetical protein